MTDELDPKLRELEAKLRRLKPFVGDGRRQTADGSRRKRCGSISAAVCGQPSAVLATAATILALVWWFPQQPPTQQGLPIAYQTILDTMTAATTDPLLPSAVCRLPSSACRLPSPNMRQQLAQLLDEMNVAELPMVAKREYPVVEIVVQTSPPPMDMPTLERMRWRFDEQMLMF